MNGDKIKTEIVKTPLHSITVTKQKERLLSKTGKVLGEYYMNKRERCLKCNELVHKKSMSIHSRYYCGSYHDEKEWKLRGGDAFCQKCKKRIDPDSVEFHVGYLCKKKPIHVQCFYCPRIFEEYRGFTSHVKHAHNKKHKFQDLISILPPAESVFSKNSRPIVVKNFFSNYLNTTDEAVSEVNSSENISLQVRKKGNYECESCGKVLLGTHSYENHKNTKCETENMFFCFYCPFKAEYSYQVLNHMEISHSIKFNTFDLIQAKLTGIIPISESCSIESLPEDNEVVFSNSQLFEPYTSQTPTFKRKITQIKSEPKINNRNVNVSGSDGDDGGSGMKLRMSRTQ